MVQYREPHWRRFMPKPPKGLAWLRSLFRYLAGRVRTVNVTARLYTNDTAAERSTFHWGRITRKMLKAQTTKILTALRPDFSSLPDDILRKIRLMSLQYKYPYTSQAPRRRNLEGFITPTPEIRERIRLSGFYGIDGRWRTYINLKKTRLGDENYLPIRTGWLMIALRHWIRRAVNAIKRQRIYNPIGNPTPAYGIKYPL